MRADFYMGVLASLLAAFVSWIINKLIEALECRSGITGKWELFIYEHGSLIKVDKMIIKHNRKTGMIKGKERRKYPYKQRHRKWKIYGSLSGRTIMLVAFASEEIDSQASGYLKMIEDKYFSGFYLKLNSKTNEIEKIEVEMKKL